jgi:hypothetical protein
MQRPVFNTVEVADGWGYHSARRWRCLLLCAAWGDVIDRGWLLVWWWWAMTECVRLTSEKQIAKLKEKLHLFNGFSSANFVRLPIGRFPIGPISDLATEKGRYTITPPDHRHEDSPYGQMRVRHGHDRIYYFKLNWFLGMETDQPFFQFGWRSICYMGRLLSQTVIQIHGESKARIFLHNRSRPPLKDRAPN